MSRDALKTLHSVLMNCIGRIQEDLSKGAGMRKDEEQGTGCSVSSLTVLTIGRYLNLKFLMRAKKQLVNIMSHLSSMGEVRVLSQRPNSQP